MTPTETMKYGNVNVHSVRGVKYHMDNILFHTSNPCRLLERGPRVDPGTTGSLVS